MHHYNSIKSSLMFEYCYYEMMQCSIPNIDFFENGVN